MTYSSETARPRRPAQARSSASWLPVSWSVVLTRAQIAQREGINKPYGRAVTIPAKHAQVSGHGA